MTHTYPYKAKQFIREAKDAMKRMQSTNSIDELKRAHISFLNAARFCTQQLLTEVSKVEGFEEWWKEKAEFLDKSEISIFFKEQRNDVTKGGDDPIAINYEITNLQMNGPLQIGPDGIMKGNVSERGPEWIPEESDSLKIKSWDFKEKPNGYTDVPALVMMNEYIKLLEEVIDEFINVFGQAK